METYLLVGGFSPTHLKKYAEVKLDHFPGRGENKKYLSCHHPVLDFFVALTLFGGCQYHLNFGL